MCMRGAGDLVVFVGTVTWSGRHADQCMYVRTSAWLMLADGAGNSSPSDTACLFILYL
jgi:hypothetical protein